jgi:hypothetical protein
MVGDFFTKPLQGSLFCKLHKIILNLPDDIEVRSYADVVQGTTKESSNTMTDTFHHPRVHHYPHQTVVNGRVEVATMIVAYLSLLSAN